MNPQWKKNIPIIDINIKIGNKSLMCIIILKYILN